MRKRFFVIHNPSAGINRRRLLRVVLAKLNAAGAVVTVRTAKTRKADQAFAADAAQSGDYDAVIAAGGDSTIRGVASGLIGSTTPLGIIPVGAGNVLAHEIGMSRRAGGIAKLLLHGKAVEAYAATVEGAPFIAMVGVGFDARVIGKLSLFLKRFLGRVAYVPPVLKALFSPLPELTAEADGVAYAANWAIITNVSHYGGAFRLSPESGIDRRGLKAVLMQISSRRELIGTLTALGLGTHLKRTNVSLIPCKTIRLSAFEPEAFQVDGELCGFTPVVIKDDDLSFQLITPDLQGGNYSNSP